MGFLRSVPRDIEEQAQVDGYSQDFIYALAFVSSSSSMTVSVGVPTVFLGRFIRGFTLGAVKG
jgi:ABC-type maltose transport system permease subunit